MNYTVLQKIGGECVIVPSDKVDEYCKTHDDVFELNKVDIYLDEYMPFSDMSFIPWDLQRKNMLKLLPYIFEFIQQNYPSLEDMAAMEFTSHIERQQILLEKIKEQIVKLNNSQE